MEERSRRQFLKATVLASGALGLARYAVSQEAASSPPAETEISIARWKPPTLEPSHDDIKRMAVKLTEQAMANLGGMSRFVKRGDVVWIKPNIGFRTGPEQAANTNPDVVGTLVRLCLEAGAKQVKVGDNSCFGVRIAYASSGIVEPVKAAGGEIVYLDNCTPRDFDINGDRLAVWPLYAEIVESDLVINVPVLKQHALTKVSACMKNYMGVAAGTRYLWHKDLPTCLADLAGFMKPRLSVLDALRVITKGGPTGGDLSDVLLKGIVAAGTDPVALDAFGAEQLGLDPQESRMMAKCEARGIGKVAYRGLKMREVEVA